MAVKLFQKSYQREGKIALVGPYPPPYGGISIHLQRLSNLLRKEGFEVETFNMGIRRFLSTEWKNLHKYSVIHFHDIRWFDRFLVGLLGWMNIKTILTVHGDMLEIQINTLPGFEAALLKFGLRHIHHIIAVKTEIRDVLLEAGVSDQRISIITAYLPPTLNEEDKGNIAPDVKAFIASHHPLLVANAFGIVYLDEHDLYGIKSTIDLVAKLKNEMPSLGFLCFLAQTDDRSCYEQMQALLSDRNLTSCYRFIVGQPFVPVLSQADVFIRPTYSDGFSVSLQEAIDLDIPSVSSDVCPRPDQTVLYEYGNEGDLIDKVRYALTHPSQKRNLSQITSHPNFLKVIEIYKEVAGFNTLSCMNKNKLDQTS